MTAEDLFESLTFGDLAGFEELVDRWVGVPLVNLRDPEGRSLLHEAALNDNAVRVLGMIGPPHAPEFLNARSAEQPSWTAVQVAVSGGHLASLQALHEAGADLRGQGLLALAIREREGGVLAYLLQNGAPVNERERDGRTPLHVAVELGSIADVRSLLATGRADLRAIDFQGQSVVHMAIAHEDGNTRQQMLDLLGRAGAALPGEGAGAPRAEAAPARGGPAP